MPMAIWARRFDGLENEGRPRIDPAVRSISQARGGNVGGQCFAGDWLLRPSSPGLVVCLCWYGGRHGMAPTRSMDAGKARQGSPAGRILINKALSKRERRAPPGKRRGLGGFWVGGLDGLAIFWRLDWGLDWWALGGDFGLVFGLDFEAYFGRFWGQKGGGYFRPFWGWGGWFFGVFGGRVYPRQNMGQKIGAI
jgi:hypothetical protein